MIGSNRSLATAPACRAPSGSVLVPTRRSARARSPGRSSATTRCAPWHWPRCWRSSSRRPDIPSSEGRHAVGQALLEDALACAREGGDDRLVADVLSLLPLVALWGPVPLVDAQARCEL